MAARPLTGLVFCCTAVEAALRAEIDEKCRAMGAIHRLDLMSDVTHMVVASIFTAKYTYAAAHRPEIVFVRPRFVSELYERWLAGDDVSPGAEAEIAEFGRLPVFDSLTVCFTNMHDRARRQQLVQTIERHGGSHSPNLTTSVHFLLTDKKPPEAGGGGTLVRADKYAFARGRNIPVVHPDWVAACIEYGAVVDHEPFDVLADPGDREAALGRIRELIARRQPVPAGPVEEVRVRRLRPRRNDTWESIMDSVVAEAEPEPAPAEEPAAPEPAPFEIVDEPVERGPERRGRENAEDALFAGHVFAVHGFPPEKASVVVDFVTARGATVTPAPAAATHLIVPYTLPKAEVPEAPGAAVVTEWYLEQSSHYRRLLPPDECRYSRHYGSGARPLDGQVAVLSGFNGMQRAHMEKLAVLLGAAVLDNLTAERDLLVVPDVATHAGVETVKMKFARRWGVRIVHESWLFALASGQATDVPARPAAGVVDERPDRRKKRLVGRATVSVLTAAATNVDAGAVGEAEPATQGKVVYYDADALHERIKVFQTVGGTAPPEAALAPPADYEDRVGKKRRSRRHV
ncbi:uncharacterized protein V1510DRAFT_366929 [Dipodascopsis tothii]|uniref:uncharacterized protein n=1 Tax=Dipodascopsis tothii TaxID=44089 RepID=UPI0034CF011E